jgi:NAD+ synthase
MNLNNNSGYSFNAKVECQHIIDWIREWFKNNGENCNAVVGISGGKDSTVVAALCKEALGADRVIGVLMPNGVQPDIEDARAVINHLGIRSIEINIEKAVNGLMGEAINQGIQMSNQAVINLPPRIRMSTLYLVSQTYNGRVANTCNLSEDVVGYSTRWGDSVGDFCPLANYTATEVVAIGKELGLPSYLVEKVPSDGLCGQTDEDNLGFTYEALDRLIRYGEGVSDEDKMLILNLKNKNAFKQKMPDKCLSLLPVCI